MRIVTGYLISFVYIFLVVFLTRFIKKRDIARKLLHISVVGLFFAVDNFWEDKIHFVIISVVALVFLLSTAKTNLLKHINEESQHGIKGLILFCISILVTSTACCIYNSFEPYFIYGLTALCVGDGFAAILGKYIKSKKIQGDKTIIGTITCFSICFFAFFIYKIFELSQLSYIQLIILSIAIAISELVTNGFDNISVVFVGFFGAFILAKLGNDITIPLLIAEGVFFVAFLSKAINYTGSIGVGIIAFTFYYVAGLFSLLYVIGCYVVLIIISIIRKILKNDISGIVSKTKTKDLIEVFVNGFFAFISIILYEVLEDSVFYLISLISISASFVDSLSSDIGTLSKKKPYDVFRKKYVESGVSGGISLLGSMASLIGSIIFAVFIVLITQSSFAFLPLIVALLMLGTFFDSLMGSLIQVKYICEKCNSITEKKIHCEEKTSYYCGVKIIDNDVVNFLSSFCVFALSFVLFLF